MLLIKMILRMVCQSQNKVLGIHTRTKKYSPLYHLQCIFVTVLSRVFPIGKLINTTVQQRPLQAH